MPHNPEHQGPPCDLLAAYELGLLGQVESQAFEAHLENCSDCLEELYAMAPSTVELRAHPGLYADQASKQLSGNSFWVRWKSLVFSGPARVFVPVAVVALLAMVLIIPRTTDTRFRDLASTEAPAFVPLQVRSGQQSPWYPLWESGLRHYQKGEYDRAAYDLDQAIELLSNETDNNPNPHNVLDNARLYLGVSRLLSGRENDSLAILTAASHSSLPPVRQKALWYLAQAHLIGEKPQAALSILRELENSPVFGSRATHQIQEIQTLLKD